MHSDFYKLCKKIEFLSEPKNVECEKKETDVEYVEVYNSFRPSVSAAISAKRHRLRFYLNQKMNTRLLSNVKQKQKISLKD